MRPVVFVAPFLLPATMRFARAAASLPDVALYAVAQEIPRGSDGVFREMVQVRDGLSPRQLIEAVGLLKRRYGTPHRLVGILEPLQEVIAAAREHYGIPGTDVATARLFRDKAVMKDKLHAAGIGVARHRLLTCVADAEAFLSEVGLPLVLKPPAGMGAKATFRVSTAAALLRAVRGMQASPERPVLAEECVMAEEGSLDTITIAGVPQVISVSHYRPTPLEVLEQPWIQWCVVLPQAIDGPHYDDVKRVGIKTIEVLGLKDGFTHMEWFRRKDGSVLVGEIALRPAGAQITHMLGMVHNRDPFQAWAQAVIDGACVGRWERTHAAGCAYLRGMGHGRIVAVDGATEIQQAVGHLVEEAKLPKLGAPKSDSYEGDGFAIVKSPDTATVEAALTKIIETIRIRYA